MTIQEGLKKYHKIEIELLLAHILKKPKEFVFMNPEYNLSTYQLTRLSTLIKRRMAGEPMAYILGYKDFYGLRFRVNKDVLVPRPETEWVVGRLRSLFSWQGEDVSSAAERQIRSKQQDKLSSPHLRLFSSRRRGSNAPIKILDIGSGSGAIIISLAKELPTHNSQLATFFASDISPAALKVAKQNAAHHGVKIKFMKSDLLKNIKFNPDIIIANLPYGWYGVKNRFSSVKDGLKFEPQKALYAKEKGLLEIRRLLEQIAQRRNQPKFIYLEFDPRQKADLSRLIKKYLPKGEIKFHKDFNNLWRYAEIEIK
jgi:release factor glutamine methyltransferase